MPSISTNLQASLQRLCHGCSGAIDISGKGRLTTITVLGGSCLVLIGALFANTFVTVGLSPLLFKAALIMLIGGVVIYFLGSVLYPKPVVLHTDYNTEYDQEYAMNRANLLSKELFKRNEKLCL